MPGDADGRVINNAIRQSQLEASHRDVTKPQPPAGTDGESLRKIRGFDGISDQMLQERASFNLKDHMSRQPVMGVATMSPKLVTLDLSSMTADELKGLRKAAEQQLKQKGKS